MSYLFFFLYCIVVATCQNFYDCSYRRRSFKGLVAFTETWACMFVTWESAWVCIFIKMIIFFIFCCFVVKLMKLRTLICYCRKYIVIWRVFMLTCSVILFLAYPNMFSQGWFVSAPFPQVISVQIILLSYKMPCGYWTFCPFVPWLWRLYTKSLMIS